MKIEQKTTKNSYLTPGSMLLILGIIASYPDILFLRIVGWILMSIGTIMLIIESIKKRKIKKSKSADSTIDKISGVDNEPKH